MANTFLKTEIKILNYNEYDTQGNDNNNNNLIYIKFEYFATLLYLKYIWNIIFLAESTKGFYNILKREIFQKTWLRHSF